MRPCEYPAHLSRRIPNLANHDENPLLHLSTELDPGVLMHSTNEIDDGSGD